MKKVLIVAYDFPPLRTSGVYRPLKFAKYLPDFGWKPIILTVSNYPNQQQDARLLDELPSFTTIYRAFTIEPKRFEKFIYKVAFEKTGDNGGTAPQQPGTPSASASGGMKSFLKRLVFSPLSRFTHDKMYTPDEHIGWIPLAVRKGMSCIRIEKPDVIFSTSPPETNHLVAQRLSQKSGLPWVVDFRDPWSDNFNRDKHSRFRNARERIMEERVLTDADKIINVGARFSELSKTSFPNILSRKHEVITNGYDESDFAGLDAQTIYNQSKTPYLHLVNVGTVYDNSGFRPFFAAFADIIKNSQYGEKIRLTFVGEVHPEVKQYANEGAFAGKIDIIGYQPHKQTIRTMMAADALLLMPAGGNRHTVDKVIPGKLFELMRSGRPVFLIGWPGETADILRQSGTGLFAQGTNIAEIAEVLKTLLAAKEAGQLDVTPNWSFIRQFDRRALTRRLATVLDEASNKSASA